MKRILYISCFVVALSACNSSPKATQSIITPTPTGISSSSSAPVAATGQKPTHNPEHGQPYHECALPVGAPFNAQAVPAVAAPPVSAPAPAAEPISGAQKEARLNPEHGQPGHTCDLPVGAPLS